MAEFHWWRLKASELNALAAKEASVIVPVASTEQHGPHLPTQVDCLLVGEIARRAAILAGETTPIVITPTVWSGLAEHHMSLGGTLSLDYAAFHALLRGICRSLVRLGFRRILLLNGHGGNIAALTVVVNELAVEFSAPIATATYWLLAEKAFSEILESQPNVRHACEAETSMTLALAPDLVDMSLVANAVGPTERELVPIAARRFRRGAPRLVDNGTGAAAQRPAELFSRAFSKLLSRKDHLIHSAGHQTEARKNSRRWWAQP